MKIKDVTSKIGSGATPTGGEKAYKKTGVSLIRSQNVLDMSFSYEGLAHIDDTQANKLDNVTIIEKDILLNITGDSIARCCMVPNDVLPARVNQHVSIVRANKTTPEYLLYFLQYLKPYLLNICKVGGTRNALTKEAIEKLPFWEIDNSEKAALIFTTIDNKILNNKAICSELESMAKLLYDYWFVQFDFPDENGKPYKSSGGKMVWNETLKHEIPEGWEAKSISSLIKDCKNGDYGSEKPNSNDDIMVSCFRGADFSSITMNYKVTAPIRYISKKNQDRLLSAGDLVIEISGGSPTQATGRIGYINQKFLDRNGSKMTCTNFCKALTPINDYYQYWLYQTWKTFYDAGVMFKYEGKTTGIKNLMFDDFINNICIPIPSEELLIQYQKTTALLYDKTQENLKESDELATMRDFLLPMLMNGQVKIRES